ncbi:hypothetical protein VIMY103929_10490 [Vibrio mytili]
MKLQVWLLIGGLLLPTLSYSGTDMVEFRGFGTLSGVYSDSDSLAFRRDMTQEGKTKELSLLSDSLLGLQTDIQITDALKATVQLVVKDRVNNSFDESLTWASLSYDFNNAWNIRAGRIASDLTLIGDVGNIAYAYDWVRPPVEFYGRIPFYHFDGVEVLYRQPLEAGHLSAKVFYGQSGSTFNYKSVISEFDLSPFTGIALRYENSDLILRTAYARTKLESVKNSRYSALMRFLAANPQVPGTSETYKRLNSYDSPIDYYTAGVEYRHKSWKWLSEISYMDSDLNTLLPSISAYVGVVKRIDNFAIYGLAAHSQTTRSNVSASPNLPDPIRIPIQAGYDGVDVKQSTASLGLRWDVAQNVAIKGQWDHSWVSANQDMLWDGETNTSDEQVNILTFSVDFIF